MAAPLVAGLVVALATHSWTVAGAADEALGPGLVTVEMTIDDSRFDVEHLRVHRGTTVEFVVHNRDFIRHELIVGDEPVHAVHATGSHPAHPPVPGEVSVGPHATGSTVYTFDAPGQVRFACHLPGHVAYGMEGTVEVL
jgi:uncharacterized cupredoxin-like copper-binding protein